MKNRNSWPRDSRIARQTSEQQRVERAEALAGAIEMQAGVPAVATVTAPTPLEEVDGEPRAIGTPAHAADDDD